MRNGGGSTPSGAKSGLPRPKISKLRPILRLLVPYRVQMALAALALAAAAGTVLGFGAGLRWLVDEGFAGGDAGRLDQALIGMLAIVTVLACASWARSYFVSWLGERLAGDIRKAVYGNVVGLDAAFFEVTRTGEIISRLTTDTTLLQTVIGTSASMAMRNILLLLGGTAMMAITSPRLTLLVFLVVPLVVAPIVIFGRRVRRLSRLSQDRIGDVGAQVDESLNAIQTVQSFAHEARERADFAVRVEQAFSVAVRRVSARAKLAALVIFLVFGAVGAILWTGGHDMVAGTISAGQLSAFVFYAVIVAGSVGAISEFVSDLQRAAGASERLVELMTAPARILAPPEPLALPRPARGQIAFEAVEFRYPSRADFAALDGFDLRVSAGEQVALVGPSGAGKSTVFRLAQRFFDPQGGRIYFDGVPIDRTDPRELRRRIGIVPQEPAIFSASARDNIRYGRPDAGEGEVRAAAEAAGAAEFLDALPQGLDTYLGERGVRLSGGQRQRVAIARALLVDPALLLLDEATSALDAESERAVQQALERLMRGRTTLVIAHRLATVQKADRIVVMDKGRIVAEGRHADLAAAGGLYARLAALQFAAGPD